MSFLTTKHASGLVGVVLLAYVVRLGLGVVAAGGVENYFNPRGAMDQELMAELGKFPGNGVLIAQLEADFPDEYEDFVDKVGKAARGTGPDNRVLVVANSWLGTFLAAHARDFAGAPLPALDAVLVAEQTYLAGLQAYDPIVCGAVVTGAPLDKPLTATLEEQAGALMASKFAAIKAGRVDQQLRFAITPKDREALVGALKERGLMEDQMKVLSGEADPSSISGELACEAAVKLNEAVRAQPDSRRALLIGAQLGGS
ncbi:MAG: hypothetical protein C0486_09755 [Erythrobacter sp.]|nr:hypothetical protein [Erythrobacter sp.]MBA4082243.1 hypothetical protein [Erythrobacter sp.]